MAGRIIVTGGAGFLGAAFVRRLLSAEEPVLVVDALTYAADEARLASMSGSSVAFERLDVCSPEFGALVKTEAPSLVFHFAAETHVTRGEVAPDTFYRTNVEGTRAVLDAAAAAGVQRVIHISTDEVYGPFSGAAFGEEDKQPGEGLATSAYARSKALADDVAMAERRVGVCVVRPTNCFGPWQHPEKAIPRWISRALAGRPLPVWGGGQQVRDWMHVDDLCAGVETIAAQGAAGQAYNLAPEGSPMANVDVARAIVGFAGVDGPGVYLTDYDRPRHDQRYAIRADRAVALGWKPTIPFLEGLRETVEWYRENERWWRNLVEDAESIYDDSEERVR